MNDLVRIKYHTEVVISIEDLVERYNEFENERIRPNFEDEIEEAEWRHEREKEAKETLEFAEAFKKLGEKENDQILTYTFNKDVIRLERKIYNAKDAYNLIDQKSGEMSLFYVIKGEPNVNKKYFYPNLDDWKVNNNIIVDKKDIKNIIGYDCYKMIIGHERVNEKEGEYIRSNYELYVTEELDLPVSLLVELWQPITKVCALEIKDIKSPRTYVIERAFEIEKGINPDEVKPPKVYGKLKTDES